MNFKTVLLLLFTAHTVHVHAAVETATALADTLNHDCTDSTSVSAQMYQQPDAALGKKRSFRPQQLIVPGALVLAGALGTINDWGEQLDPIHKRHMPEWHKAKMLHPDKWTQFVPSFFGIGLNVCGVKSSLSRQERLMLRVTSFALSASVAWTLKHTVSERRPNGEDNHSFPSGHATTAFQGAELVRMEYGGWYGVTAYVMATGVAVSRIVYDKHWIHDVVAGAGLGILSARASLWLLPAEKKLLAKWQRKHRTAVAALPYYDAGQRAAGGVFALAF